MLAMGVEGQFEPVPTGAWRIITSIAETIANVMGLSGEAYALIFIEWFNLVGRSTCRKQNDRQ